MITYYLEYVIQTSWWGEAWDGKGMEEGCNQRSLRTTFGRRI